MRGHRLVASLALSLAACSAPPTTNLSVTGTLTGTVTSSLGPALGGITVMATTEFGTLAPAATISNSQGHYTISNVPIGTGGIIVSSPPSGCAQATAYYTMPSATTVTINIVVRCGITTGTVSGDVSSTQGGAILGATVTVTPTGGKPLPPATTGSGGYYAVDSVPASPSTGTVTVGGLPAGCTAPATVAYSGLTPAGTAAANITVSCKVTATTAGLWVDGQYLFTTTQLAQSGSPTPADSCPGAGSSFSGGAGPAAFDASGNLWTQHSAGAIIAWTPTQLAAACGPATPAISLPFSGGTIAAMAFDAHGTLWVSEANAVPAIILGYSAAQLAATSSGNVVPAYTVTALGGIFANMLDQPGALAFDASGNLWVANGISVIEYSAAQLAAATTGSGGTTATPAHYLTNSAGLFYLSVAFDAHGNLWSTVTATYGSSYGDTTSSVSIDSIFAFTPSQLSSLGTNTTPTPNVLIGESESDSFAGTTFGALAFDASGNLWLGENAVGGGGSIVRYPAANIAPGASGQSDVTITNPSGLVGYGFSLAFNPTPTGLPINGERVRRVASPTFSPRKRITRS